MFKFRLVRKNNKDNRKTERNISGTKPRPVFDVWGSFGGISDNVMRARVLSVLWLVIMLLSLPDLLLKDKNYLNINIVIMIFLFFVSLTLWYADWNNLNEKFLAIKKSTWLHLALWSLIIEIITLNVTHETLRFSLAFLYVAGYITYFYDIKILVRYFIGLSVLMTLPFLMSDSYHMGTWLLLGLNYMVSAILVSLFIYWQKVKQQVMEKRLRGLSKLNKLLSREHTFEDKRLAFMNYLNKTFDPEVQILWGKLDKLSYLGIEGDLFYCDNTLYLHDLVQLYDNEQPALDSRPTWEEFYEKDATILMESDLSASHKFMKNFLLAINCPQLLITPIYLADNEDIGLAMIGSRSATGFTTSDVEFFKACVNEYASSLQAYILEMNNIKNKQVAGIVQQSLLPQVPLKTTNLEIAFIYQSAAGEEAELGGDYYDFFNIDSERIGLVIGDNVGHGVSAAKLTGMIKYSLRSILQLGFGVRKIMNKTNEIALEQIEEHLVNDNMNVNFSTMLYSEYNKKRKGISLVNAGHHTPIICSKQGEIINIPTQFSFTPLGLDDPPCQRFTEIKLENDSLYVLYTDGIIESKNIQTREMFGQNRLEKAILKNAQLPTKNIPGKILDEVYQYGGGKIEDDATILVVRILKGVDQSWFREEIICYGISKQDKAHLRSFVNDVKTSYKFSEIENENSFFSKLNEIKIGTEVKIIFQGSPHGGKLSWNIQEKIK